MGDPLLKQLGTVTPSTSITQVSVNPLNGNVFATDGNQLVQTDFTAGGLTLVTPVTVPTSATPLGISGIAFDNNGTLFGVSTINNQNPTTVVGGINPSGDVLHAMAVDPLGNIYAIDSSSSVDTLVRLDPMTGAE